MSYKDWLNVWLDNAVKPTAKSRTYARYKEIIDGHIVPKLGDYELNDLTPLLLQKFVTELLQSGNLITGLDVLGDTMKDNKNQIINSKWQVRKQYRKVGIDFKFVPTFERVNSCIGCKQYHNLILNVKVGIAYSHSDFLFV